MSSERQQPDFYFTNGKWSYRGRGTRALIALAIVHIPRATIVVGIGAIASSPILLWLIQVVRFYVER
jgi:hypothetical protein